MADPTLQLTFRDMIVRVAEFLGVAYKGAAGDQAAQVPTDVYDLDMCKRLVNDGYRKFLLSNTRWRFLTPNVDITFVAGTDTYDMPAGFFGSIIGPFIPAASSGRPKIDSVPEEYIREMKVNGAAGGDPVYYAIRPKTANQSNTSVAPRWEVIFWPAPSAAYTVSAPARLIPNALVELTDTPVAGFQHADAILAFSLAEAERQRDGVIGVQAAASIDALSRSKAIDAESAPKRRGYNGDRSDDAGMQRPNGYRPYTGVDTYNGNPV